MPTLIPAGRNFHPDNLDTGFSPNHECALATGKILSSLKELSGRPEMAELADLIKQSPQYFSREDEHK
jgi:hypothetical protein